MCVSLSDAESTKYQIEYVVRRRHTGDFVERAQRVVEIEEEHLVRDAGGDGVGSGGKRG